MFTLNERNEAAMKKRILYFLTVFVLVFAYTGAAEETYQEQTAFGYPFGVDFIINGTNRDWVYSPCKIIAGEIKNISGLQVNVPPQDPEKKGGIESFAIVTPFVLKGENNSLNVIGLKTGLEGGYFRGVNVYGLDTALLTDDGNTVYGLQMSMLAYAQKMVGLQLTPIYSVADSAGGLQVGVLASFAKELYGFQIGAIGGVTENTYGFQINGLGSIAVDTANGLQLGALVTKAETLNGVQIAGLGNLVRKGMNGLQIGLLNFAGPDSHGVQIGLFNCIDGGWLPAFPLINFNFNTKK